MERNVEVRLADGFRSYIRTAMEQFYQNRVKETGTLVKVNGTSFWIVPAEDVVVKQASAPKEKKAKEKFFTATEAAKWFKCNRKTIKRLICSGELTAEKLSSGAFGIPRSSIMKLEATGFRGNPRKRRISKDTARSSLPTNHVLEEGYVTVAQVAKMAGVCVNTVRNHIRRNILGAKTVSSAGPARGMIFGVREDEAKRYAEVIRKG